MNENQKSAIPAPLSNFSLKYAKKENVRLSQMSTIFNTP